MASASSSGSQFASPAKSDAIVVSPLKADDELACGYMGDLGPEQRLIRRCLRCEEELTEASLAKTTSARKRWSSGVAAECDECMKNYKCLTRKWKSNSQLKTWFGNKTDEDRSNWYREQKAVSQVLTAAQRKSEKRKISAVMGTEQTTGSAIKKMLHWKPFALVERDLMTVGYSKDGALQEWRRRVMDAAFKVRKIDEVWHLAEYQGVMTEDLQQTLHSSRLEVILRCSREPHTNLHLNY
jgi:hypothetical protein